MLSLRFPHSPFSTPLSGSAKEVEQRLRSIFRPPEKRPPSHPAFVLYPGPVLRRIGVLSGTTRGIICLAADSGNPFGGSPDPAQPGPNYFG